MKHKELMERLISEFRWTEAHRLACENEILMEYAQAHEIPSYLRYVYPWGNK